MKKIDFNKKIDSVVSAMYIVNVAGEYFDIEKFIIKSYMVDLDNLNEGERFIEILEAKNIILKSSDKLKMLTDRGKKIHERGGWLKYNRSLRRSKVWDYFCKAVIFIVTTLIIQYIANKFGWL